MRDDAPQYAERFFPADDMVAASELREFLFCERAWLLNRQGYRVSAKAEAHRAAGMAFHEQCAEAGRAGASPWSLRWAIILAGAGIAILLLQFWSDGR